jgi:hypothetical protein
MEEIMFHRRLLTLLSIILFAGAAALPVEAQDALKACETQTATFDTWTACLIDKVATPLVNQRHPAKQVEVPSIAENTTSLVDQTSSPDLAGLALNFAGLKSNSAGTGNGASGTMTTSAYALYAAAVRRDPLDPAFYMSHPDLRRFSFTFGQDGAGENDAKTNNATTVLGFKILLLNWRDIASHKNDQRLMSASTLLAKSAVATLNIDSELQDYLYKELGPTLGCNQGNPPNAASNNSASNLVAFAQNCLRTSLTATISSLSPEQRKVIKAIVSRHIDDPANFVEAASKDVWQIRRAPQLSFTFQSKLRNGTGDDEYRTGVLFDYGVYERLNLTLNGTFDYKDSKVIGGDTRGGRLAAEGIFQLTPNKSTFGDPRPFLLSASTEAKWMNNRHSTYTGQIKLTIPVPGLTGVNFPISVSVANRSDLITEKVVRGRFGFTIDITKLLSKTP